MMDILHAILGFFAIGVFVYALAYVITGLAEDGVEWWEEVHNDESERS